MCRDNKHPTFQLIGGGIAVCGECGEEVQMPEGVEMRHDITEEVKYLESLLPPDYFHHCHWTPAGAVLCTLVDCGYRR